MLRDVRDHLSATLERVTDERARVLFDTAFQVLDGLVRSFAQYQVSSGLLRDGLPRCGRFEAEEVTMLFRDRWDAGRQLAERVIERRASVGPDVMVLALPRGGVPVAYEVARALDAPLDVFVVRKLGVPGHEELAMGAIATGGVCVLNDDVVHALGIPGALVRDEDRVSSAASSSGASGAYRGDRAAAASRGTRTVILVDDGLATGSTMRAAVAALRAARPGPHRRRRAGRGAAAPATGCRSGPRCVCAVTPEPFHAVGLWYEDFSQTTDDEVRDLLERSAAPVAAATGRDAEAMR